MEKVIKIRNQPLDYKDRESTKEWLETLGPYIQRFANVLEENLREKENNLNE